MSRRFSIALWTILLAAFVLLGIHSVWGNLNLRLPHSGPPLADLDAILNEFISVPDGSNRIVNASAPVKPAAPILVSGPGDDPAFCEMYTSLSYLLWPHPLWELGKVTTGKPPRFNFMPKEQLYPSQMFFFYQEPPPEVSGSAKEIGRHLKSLLLKENN